MNLHVKRAKELFTFFIGEMKKDGIIYTTKRAIAFFKRRFGKKQGRFLPFKSALELQKKADTSKWPFIDICVPLYNTPDVFLHEMLQSVLNQTCDNWVLCLADASETGRLYNIISAYKCNKIKYIKIINNGISANTNEAARLSQNKYIALLDHDDVLSPNAIYEMAAAAFAGHGFIYSDEALFKKDITKPITGHFKPSFAPDYLRCVNYICHFAAFKRTFFDAVSGLSSMYDGAQDHDLFLKLSEHYPPYHIAKVLYYWRVHEQSTSLGTAAKPYVKIAAKAALNAHLERTKAVGQAVDGLFDSTYKINYIIQSKPLVSIIIPNKDHIDDLEKLLSSIDKKTVYRSFEVIIVENNSVINETFVYYKAIAAKYPFCRVVNYEGSFNFSAITNFGAKAAKGEYLLLLNNDTEIINGEWLYEMLSLCTLDGVGIVGAKLLYNDNTIQHAGVITGLGGFAGHSHKYARGESSGYMFRLSSVQNLSAVTAACLMVSVNAFNKVNGFCEEFAVAFNDVDFCLRVKNAGYRILYTPYAQLYHYESKSRGLDTSGEAKQRFTKEKELLYKRYGTTLLHDEFYSPNLTLDREDFSENDVFPRDV